MGVKNPVETTVGILALIDEVRAKMSGTKLATYPWRPATSASADQLALLLEEALPRCDDPTEALIVVTTAAMLLTMIEKIVVAGKKGLITGQAPPDSV
jgi:hypothetical protein